jgi:hypothetical protein
MFSVRREAIAPARHYLSALQCQFSIMLTARLHIYEVRPSRDRRGFDLICDALSFGRLWCGEPNPISYAQFNSRSHDAVIRV